MNKAIPLMIDESGIAFLYQNLGRADINAIKFKSIYCNHNKQTESKSAKIVDLVLFYFYIIVPSQYQCCDLPVPQSYW